MGQHFGTLVSTVGIFTCVTVLAYIYLDDWAASLIMVTLLPLATVPIFIRSSLSIKAADDAESSNERSNHVCIYNYMQLCMWLDSFLCMYTFLSVGNV